MIFGSTSKNISMLTFLGLVIFSIYGIFNFTNFTLDNILISLASFYILNIMGIWLTYHRYFSHRSFKFRNRYFEWIFTAIGVLAGRGSPLGWAYLHRLHHRHSDTEKDPHSPLNIGFKFFGFDHMKNVENKEMQIFLVKDLITPEQLFIHKYYALMILSFMAIFSLINFELFYFLWIIPMVLVHFTISIFNYFGHKSGYRNFRTPDNSKNNFWLFPILLGDCWHNNHHANPKTETTKLRKFEIDPLSLFLVFIKK